MINREDMLEITRRMTPERTCFDRIAGAYIDDLGELEDSFNIHFGKLSGAEMHQCLVFCIRLFRIAVQIGRKSIFSMHSLSEKKKGFCISYLEICRRKNEYDN